MESASAAAATKPIRPETETKSEPSLSVLLAYGVSRRRKSAVQIHWIRLSRITVRPNVTISDVSSWIPKRRKPSCSTTPKTKKAGTTITSVTNGSSLSVVAIWYVR